MSACPPVLGRWRYSQHIHFQGGMGRTNGERQGESIKTFGLPAAGDEWCSVTILCSHLLSSGRGWRRQSWPGRARGMGSSSEPSAADLESSSVAYRSERRGRRKTPKRRLALHGHLVELLLVCDHSHALQVGLHPSHHLGLRRKMKRNPSEPGEKS